jgi:PIN domain nuclease of toxin-antitoxin system
LSRWLADACALVDFYTADPALPRGVRTLLENDPSDVAIAATTVWEIAIKTARGKLVDVRAGRHATLAAMLHAHGFDLQPLDAATAEQAAALPPLHADPFDRALVALAQRSGRTVLTSDAVIGRYGVPVRWRS